MNGSRWQLIHPNSNFNTKVKHIENPKCTNNMHTTLKPVYDMQSRLSNDYEHDRNGWRGRSSNDWDFCSFESSGDHKWLLLQSSWVWNEHYNFGWDDEQVWKTYKQIGGDVQYDLEKNRTIEKLEFLNNNDIAQL